MFRRFFIFGFGNGLSALIPFLLLPILTKMLNPSDMGVVAFFESLILLLAPLVIFGVDGSYSTFFHKISNRERKSLSVSLLQISALMSIVLFLLSCFIVRFKIIPMEGYNLWVYLFAPLMLAKSINSLLFSQFQMSGEVKKYAALKVAISIFSAFISLFAIYNIKADAGSRLLGMYIGPIFISIFCVFVMYFNGIFKESLYRPDLIRKGFNFGVGMVLHSWSAIIFFSSDRIIIGYMTTSESLGKYFVAVQVGMIMAVVQNTFSQVWTPYCFRLFAQNKFSLYVKNCKLSMFFLGISSVIMMFLVPFFYEVFIDKRYHDIMGISYWVVATYFFLGLYKIYVVKLFFFEKTKILATITTGTAIFNVVLTILFINFFGIYGAVIATFISSIIFFLLVYMSSLALVSN